MSVYRHSCEESDIMSVQSDKGNRAGPWICKSKLLPDNVLETISGSKKSNSNIKTM